MGLLDHDEAATGSAQRAARGVGIHPPGTGALYRGWMLPVARYELLYQALGDRGVRLANTPEAYRTCHWLPESYPFIEGSTPESVWIPVEELMFRGVVDWERVVAAAEELGPCALVVKDYVKSQKHRWDEACYIPRSNDADVVKRVVSRFLELQGDDLAGGLVVRRYIPLRPKGRHPRSGMPLSDEYRLFFLDHRPILVSPYWDVEPEELEKLPLSDLTSIARRIPSRFFSMDVAFA